MNIGIEVQRIFRSKKHGMEIVSMEIIRELQQLDKSNNYTLFSKKDEDEISVVATKNFLIDNTITGSYPVWEQIGLPSKIKNLKLDLLHCTANTAPLFCKVPTVITIHDVIYMESLSFKGSAYQNFGNIYRKLVVPKVVKNSKAVITVSHFEKGVIEKRLPSSLNKLEVIYNGVNKKFNAEYSLEQINDFKRKHFLPNNFILFLGNTAPKKNTPTFIEAYADYCELSDEIIPLVVLDYKKELVEVILDVIESIYSVVSTPGLTPGIKPLFLFKSSEI